MRLMAIGLWVVLCLAGVPVMANSKSFVCVNEKDHLPPLDSQADAWYREAAALAKPDTLRPWGRIVELYSKAVERGHWKAMHNLANLYRTGWPGGVEKDTQKALDLYQKMIDLDVPQGFYDMGAMIGNRAGVKNPATDGLTFLDKAASLGNPPALTELGKLYIYVAKKKDLGLASKPDAELVIKALDMAYEQRGKPQQVLFHSDQGSQGGFNRPSQHWVAE